MRTRPRRRGSAVSIDLRKARSRRSTETQPGSSARKRGKCATLTARLQTPRHDDPVVARAFQRARSARSSAAACRAPSASGVHPLHRNRRAVCPGRQQVIHAILGQLCRAHKHPLQVLAWLAEHPRGGRSIFTPTSCSWLNAVEGFFKLTRQSLKRRRLSLGRRPRASAITRYIAATQQEPQALPSGPPPQKPFRPNSALNHPSEVSVHLGTACSEAGTETDAPNRKRPSDSNKGPSAAQNRNVMQSRCPSCASRRKANAYECPRCRARPL